MRVFDKVHPIIIAWQGGLWQGSIALGDRYRHTFGGPLDLSVRGFPTNRRPLHRLLTLIAGPRLRDRRSSLASRLPPYRSAGFHQGLSHAHAFMGFPVQAGNRDHRLLSRSVARFPDIRV
jgi:hypothetical protein